MINALIDEDALSAVNAFELPEQLGFGRVPAPLMFWAEYMGGIWGQGNLEPNRPIQLEPSAKVLHYGQEIFEGMKAYRVGCKHASLFRPELNWMRFNQSAQRMAMPETPRELFMEGLYLMTAWCESIIPGSSGQSLYLRPFMFATEPSLDVSTANRFLFMVVGSPSEALHSGSVRVLIERRWIRAAAGGTGMAKTGGNYAGSFASRQRAQQLGYDQTLWLDASDQDSIEELSVMNFFAVIKGELHTPVLSGSLLDGVTRNSIIKLAETMGIKVLQRTIRASELIRQIESGECSEAFCCGTAAIVSPISELGEEDGTRYPLSQVEGALTLKLKEALLGIQENRQPDPFSWVNRVPSHYYPSATEG